MLQFLFEEEVDFRRSMPLFLPSFTLRRTTVLSIKFFFRSFLSLKCLSIVPFEERGRFEGLKESRFESKDKKGK